MRKPILLTLALALTFGFTASAQSFLENSQVSGSFQADAQYYMLDSGIGIDDLNGKQLGLNSFGKVNYTNGNFSAGIRFEAFLPELNGFRNELNGVGLANFYATYDNGFIGVTVGDVYDQFGSGLVFRSYEEWSLGMDNALRGGRIVVRPTQGVTFKGVYGLVLRPVVAEDPANLGQNRDEFDIAQKDADLEEAVPKMEAQSVHIATRREPVHDYREQMRRHHEER